jgi:hypothetical protein
MGEWRYKLKHSEPRLEMEMRCQLDASITLLPREEPSLPLVRGEEWVRPRTGLDTVGKRTIPIPEGN